MKLYLLHQSETRGYDTYSSAVVCANSMEEAKTIHPSGDIFSDRASEWDKSMWKVVPIWNAWRDQRNWAKSPENVDAKYIGEAADDMKFGVVLSSYTGG